MGTFLRRIFASLLFLLALVLVGSACTITLGPYDDAEGTGPQRTSALPAPKNGPADEPLLDAAQQARKEEADRYIASVVYKGGEILQAIQLPSGDVLDFIKRDTLPALPYELPTLPFAPEDLVLPEGVEFGLTELEQSTEMLELAAMTTPFHRPTFWPYILGEAPDATSIEDYLARYTEGGQPSSGSRLYAGIASLKWNRGVSGYMNQFRPHVEPDSFSLIEFTVFCPAEGPVQEQIGIVISVDKSNVFGVNRQKQLDGEARLHIEYARPVNGKVPYVWDEMDSAFVANPFRLHHPGQRVPVSTLGGTRVEHLLAIFQVPWGDWWITYNGNFLGYYPASSFTMLNGGACGSAWYGEVFNQIPEAIDTEMGSGNFAEAGLLSAAYVRNPVYFDLSWQQVEPQDDWSMIPYNPLCYDRSPLWEHHMILGGPGGKNPACQW